MFKIKRLLIIFPFDNDVLDFQVEKVLSIVMQIKCFLCENLPFQLPYILLANCGTKFINSYYVAMNKEYVCTLLGFVSLNIW